MKDRIRLAEDLSLTYAGLEDRPLIYDLLVSDQTLDFMFDDNHSAPSYEEFSEEATSFYRGKACREGHYLLINYQGMTVGSVSYSLNEGEIPTYELDIWIGYRDYLGQGIGRRSLRGLMSYLARSYQIESFLIRPWKKNTQALRAYEKCGFRYITKDDLKIYYSPEDYEVYRQGDYGIDTANMVCVWEET